MHNRVRTMWLSQDFMLDVDPGKLRNKVMGLDLKKRQKLLQETGRAFDSAGTRCCNNQDFICDCADLMQPVRAARQPEHRSGDVVTLRVAGFRPMLLPCQDESQVAACTNWVRDGQKWLRRPGISTMSVS